MGVVRFAIRIEENVFVLTLENANVDVIGL